MPPVRQPANHICIDITTLELLAGWTVEDATNDAEAIRAANQEFVEFKKTMNENRGMDLTSS